MGSPTFSNSANNTDISDCPSQNTKVNDGVVMATVASESDTQPA